MFARLIFLFIVVPIAELVLLLYLADRYSYGARAWQSTVLIVLVTGVVGATLARRQGRKALRRIADTIDEGRMPGAELIDAALILVAGVLLVMPGVTTDLAGLLLLFPFGRALARRWLLARFRRRVEMYHMQRRTTFDAEGRPVGDIVIETHVVETPERPSDVEPD